MNGKGFITAHRRTDYFLTVFRYSFVITEMAGLMRVCQKCTSEFRHLQFSHCHRNRHAFITNFSMFCTYYKTLTKEKNDSFQFTNEGTLQAIKVFSKKKGKTSFTTQTSCSKDYYSIGQHFFLSSKHAVPRQFSPKCYQCGLVKHWANSIKKHVYMIFRFFNPF